MKRGSDLGKLGPAAIHREIWTQAPLKRKVQPTMPQSTKPHRSFWLDQALRETSFQIQPTLRGPTTADVVIVGGGYCGMWTAYELKQRQPNLDIVIVERDFCGAGASGRNGGYLVAYWAQFHAIERLCGTDPAMQTCIATDTCTDEIEDFLRDHNIDAGFRRNGMLWGATCKAHMGGWEPVMAALQRLNRTPFEIVSKTQLHDGWGLTGMLGAVIEPGAANVQPAKLALGIRKVLLELGVRIYEQTPMVSIRTGKSVEIVTDQGAVSAAKAVLALNAWGVRLRQIRQQIFVTSSELAISKPAPEWIEKTGWSTAPAIIDSRGRLGAYAATADSRVLFSKGGAHISFGAHFGPAFDGPVRALAQIRAEFEQTVPAAAELVVDKTWAGPIDRSIDGLPIFSFLNDDRIVYGTGFSGHGVGPTKLGGKIIASLVLKTKDMWSTSPFVRTAPAYPPEPIKYIGARLVRNAVHRTDQLAHLDKQPSRLTRWLASRAVNVTPAKKQSSSAGH
jgi:glycine/D-amino acid oxidase-like deaminating enzyme